MFQISAPVTPPGPRLKALAACAGLAVLASACASLPSAPANLPLPTSAAAVEDYDWHYDKDGEEVQLAYGVANSDDIPFGFFCRAGSGQIRMVAASFKPEVKTITLATSETSQTYRARQEASEMFEGYFLEASTSPNDPLLVSFIQQGWLAIENDGRWVSLAPQPGTKTEGHAFVSACR